LLRSPWMRYSGEPERCTPQQHRRPEYWGNSTPHQMSRHTARVARLARTRSLRQAASNCCRRTERMPESKPRGSYLRSGYSSMAEACSPDTWLGNTTAAMPSRS
jgi:hypothetical protein